MKFAIFTHVPHLRSDSNWYAYAPYVREMNLWIKNTDCVLIVSPVVAEKPSPIHLAYKHSNITLLRIRSFDVKTFRAKMKTIFKLPAILYVIFSTMKKADHIHLRCPGNIGLLACMVQVFFPNKKKTAKYAGNWDPNARQPLSYKMQRWILSNTFLTKNMQVLVYGEWPNQTKNIKPFFTATYCDNDKQPLLNRTLDGVIELLFVGTLSAGKQPLYALQLAAALLEKGYWVRLRLYGEGIERERLEHYSNAQDLGRSVFLLGNRSKEEVQKAYQESHFLILPSKSEGWPKAVAEAMFWGCIPVTTNVSCVAYMLDNGKRGIVLNMNLEKDVQNIIELINNDVNYQEMIYKAVEWSRTYTVNLFEEEIDKLLQA